MEILIRPVFMPGFTEFETTFGGTVLGVSFLNTSGIWWSYCL